MNKYMSIGDIHLVETDNSDEFYYGEIYALAAKIILIKILFLKKF